MVILRYKIRITQCFFDMCSDPTRNTLEDIILQFILLGTKIINDCWATYNIEFLECYNYIHDTVNHS